MICRRCKEDKPIELFYQRKDRKSPCTRCKECDAISLLEYRHRNWEGYLEKARIYINKNKDSINARRRHSLENPIKRAKENQRSKEWTLKNREKVLIRKRASRTLKKDQINQQERLLRKNDLNYKIRSSLRTRFKQAIRTGLKNKKASEKSVPIKMLGCTIDQFKKYIESQFKEGMTWDNWNQFGWHLDHIKPLSKFDLTNENELKHAVHYTNMQPLWWQENLSKHAKYNGEKE